MSTDDLFCPRHGRRSRPVEIEGLCCDCTANDKAYQELVLYLEVLTERDAALLETAQVRASLGNKLGELTEALYQANEEIARLKEAINGS